MSSSNVGIAPDPVPAKPIYRRYKGAVLVRNVAGTPAAGISGVVAAFEIRRCVKGRSCTCVSREDSSRVG